MRFTKMHGNGNDYIYVECFTQDVCEEDVPRLARAVSERHSGIGSDGLVLVRPSAIADCRMDIYNADGSRGRMCGNAIRCVGKFLYDRGYNTKKTITVETLRGIKTLELRINADGVCETVRVNMGGPDFSPSVIPMDYDGADFIGRQITAAGRDFTATCVNSGSSHIVVYVDDVEAYDVPKYGPALENHMLFPDRVNANFVQVISRSEIKSRTWERGSGETMACGSGACGCAVVSALLNKTERMVTVRQRGGYLLIEWDEKTGDIFMTGPAAFICDGEYLPGEVL